MGKTVACTFPDRQYAMVLGGITALLRERWFGKLLAVVLLGVTSGLLLYLLASNWILRVIGILEAAGMGTLLLVSIGARALGGRREYIDNRDGFPAQCSLGPDGYETPKGVVPWSDIQCAVETYGFILLQDSTGNVRPIHKKSCEDVAAVRAIIRDRVPMTFWFTYDYWNENK